ncbi:PD-(D/E)XK nuclease family protein [Leptolyngbya sp. FACHB-321]|uniref:PD-(D/E)XK nuclease family protein n=1 Tax=Leptolyngbya sp. FACHB-321 TaxID=2692807 RepID=UPI001689D8F1|nr:PD-(D/E)XK nuclease family protein [Leptolyngbya sp. FACHB-321]
MKTDQFHQLLDAFKSLSSPIKDPTFMEIAGYPHYENVCSNILAFYFQPDAPHGLSDLCLKALMSLASDYEPQSNVTVEREVVTKAGNRIDILIQSDTHLIAIENKIYHSAVNPFHDYAAFLQQQRSHRKLTMFLLSLYPVEDQNLHGFIPIRYADFFSKLRPLMGDYLVGANTKFLISLTDFIETIENLMRGSVMDESMFNLFNERGSEIVALLEEVNKFKAELRKKVSELGSLIDYQNKPVEIKQWYYRKERALLDVLVHDIYLPNSFVVAIDCVLTVEGWKIAGYDRKGDLESARTLFNNLQIPLKQNSNSGDRLEHITTYPYKEPLTTIQAVTQEWIDKIAATQVP